MRPLVVGAAGAAAAVATATLVGLSAAGDGGAAAAPTAPARARTATPPVPVPPCWIGGADGDVFLTIDQAKALTTAAATAVRRRDPQARLAAAVAVALDQPAEVSGGLAQTLLGAGRATRLSCQVFRDTVQPEKAGRSRLTPRAQRLRRAWTELFGALPAGGFASGGVRTGHVDDSSHYEGRAMDVFFRPVGDAAQARRGWVFAQWVAAHADDYDVLSVIYADHIWTSWASASGWRDYVHPSGNRRNAVLRHLDHVHVAVESGRAYRPR